MNPIGLDETVDTSIVLPAESVERDVLVHVECGGEFSADEENSGRLHRARPVSSHGSVGSNAERYLQKNREKARNVRDGARKCSFS